MNPRGTRNGVWTEKIKSQVATYANKNGGFKPNLAADQKIISIEDSKDSIDRDYDDFYWKVDAVRLTANLETQGLPEETAEAPHELDPGMLIKLNDDDNNANGVQDRSDTSAVTGENDLVPVTLSYSPAITAGEVKLSIPAGADKVRVYKQANKSDLVLDSTTTSVTWTVGAAPQTVYVEGVANSDKREVTLQLDVAPYANASQFSSDQVKGSVRDYTRLVAFYGAGPVNGFGNYWLERTARGADPAPDLYEQNQGTSARDGLAHER
jgi:hypothetical protein